MGNNHGLPRLSPVISGVAILLAVLLPVASAAQTPVTTCDQNVRGDAVLVSDLDCSSSPYGANVNLDSGAKLDLSNHTYTGDITCTANCTVTGPGTVNGSFFPYGAGCNIFERHLFGLTLSSATVNGGLWCLRSLQMTSSQVVGDISGYRTIKGIERYNGSIKVFDSSIEGSVTADIVTIENSVVVNGEGISCRTCKVIGSDISNSLYDGINCHIGLVNDHVFAGYRGTVEISDSTIQNNAHDGVNCAQKATITRTAFSGNGGSALRVSGTNEVPYITQYLGKALVRDSTLDHNTYGIFAERAVTVENSSIAMNQVGVASNGNVTLKDTSITDNADYGVLATNSEAPGRVTLTASTVVGNGTADADDETCDLRTSALPVLVNGSACDTSWSDGAVPWGVCSLDP